MRTEVGQEGPVFGTSALGFRAPLRPKCLTMWQDNIHLWHLPQSLFIIKGIFIKKISKEEKEKKKKQLTIGWVEVDITGCFS